MVAYVQYVHIDYSAYQFSEESNGPVLAIPKKRGPERVKVKIVKLKDVAKI